MSDSRELRAMRSMAWERAKGELHSMLHTYYESSSGKGLEKYDKAKNIINSFIELVEDECIQE